MAKDFKLNNPAERFITAPIQNTPTPAEQEHKAPAKVEQVPEGYKINPMYIETKSKRVAVLMKPSTHTGLVKMAQEQGRSVNDLINEILEGAINP